MTPDKTLGSINGNDVSPDSKTGQIPSLSQELKDITVLLNSIRCELASQSEQLARLTQKNSTKKTLPEFLPCEKDWDERELHAWYQSLVPEELKLETMRGVFRGAFTKSPWLEENLQVFIPSLSVPPEAEGSTSNDFFNDLDLLINAWPAKLTADAPEPDNCPVPDKESRLAYFNWLCPYRVWHLLELHRLEMQYDSQGYPEVKGESRERDDVLLESLSKKQPDTAVEKPWLGSVYGRIISIEVNKAEMLPVQAVAFILWQLHHPDMIGYLRSPYREMAKMMERSGVDFILSFVGRWGYWGNFSCCGAASQRDLFLRFRVRWMDMTEIADGIQSRDFGDAVEPGFRLWRGQGGIPYSTSDGVDISWERQLVERRHALAVRTTTYTRLPRYTMVTLFDEYWKLQRLWEGERVRNSSFDTDTRRSKKLQSCRCGSLTGIAVFLAEIALCLETVAREWSLSLDDLDSNSAALLGRLTPAGRRELMFDNGDFRKSEQYFAILQALRLCRDWVSETIQDVRHIPDKIHEELDFMREGMTEDDLLDRPQELERLDAILSRLVADCEAMFNPLLDRIERKNEEIKSLRDGLFNATSVREASKGTSLAENSALLNRYILVFTVATIFYLPMGFVTSFYGMHLFDPGDVSSASRTPFIITFVMISVGTYVIAGCALWLVKFREAEKLFGGWGRSGHEKNPIRWTIPDFLPRRKPSDPAV